jgi:hypothetical protein
MTVVPHPPTLLFPLLKMKVKERHFNIDIFKAAVPEIMDGSYE